MMTDVYLARAENLDLSEVLDALSDLTRRRILRRLSTADFCCSSFQELGPKTRLTYHFARLERSGLIKVTKSGRRRILSLRRDEVEACFPNLLTSVLESTLDMEQTSSGDELSTGIG